MTVPRIVLPPPCRCQNKATVAFWLQLAFPHKCITIFHQGRQLFLLPLQHAEDVQFVVGLCSWTPINNSMPSLASSSKFPEKFTELYKLQNILKFKEL